MRGHEGAFSRASADKSGKAIFLSIFLVGMLVAMSFNVQLVGADDETIDSQESMDQQEDGNHTVTGDERVIGTYFLDSEQGNLTEESVHFHHQGMKIRAPPSASAMLIDSGYIEEQIGPFSARGPFDIGENGWVHLDRRVGHFEGLNVQSKEVFTMGSAGQVQFLERPMWISVDQESYGSTIRLKMEDGDTSGQQIFLAKEWLWDHGIARPLVVHEDGTVLQVSQTDDRTGYIVDVHHFSEVEVRPEEAEIKGRTGTLVFSHEGDSRFDSVKKEWEIDVANHLVDYEVMVPKDAADMAMPNLGLVNHTWVEETWEGDEYYVVELAPKQTPTTLRFMEYRPIEYYTFTTGNPDNIQLFPFNATAREELGPVFLRASTDGSGISLSIDVNDTQPIEVLIADKWVDSSFLEHPVFEKRNATGVWVSAGEKPLIGGDFLLRNSSTFRLWNSESGPLIPSSYEVQEGGVVRGVGGCGIRHLVVLGPTAIIQDGSACMTSAEVLELMDKANQVHWRYDPELSGSQSVAGLCALFFDGSQSGNVTWVGSPCTDYQSPEPTLPPFLSDHCAQLNWTGTSEAAFCGAGITRHEATGIPLGTGPPFTDIMNEVLFFNDALAEELNEILGDPMLSAEWAWLDEVHSFLKTLRLDEPCLAGGSLLIVERNVPETACGRTLGNFTYGNETVTVDQTLLQGAWDILYNTRPCDGTEQTFLILDENESVYCGDQIPIIRNKITALQDAVKAETGCDEGRKIIFMGFGENATHRWICGWEAANPDERLVPALSGFGTAANVCYADHDGTGNFSSGDEAYLTLGSCDTQVAPGDFRFRDEGSKVAAGDSDVGAPLVSPGNTSEFRFLDADANGFPDPGDNFYLCMSDPVPCTTDVAERWIRLSTGSYSAGTLVGKGDDDLGLATKADNLNANMTNHFRYWDLDEDGAFNGDDVLYWTTTGTTTNPSIGHVRLGWVNDTQEFGEVLESGMTDIVEHSWYKLRTWGPCEDEMSFILDLNGSAPERLCGEETTGLKQSFNITADLLMPQSSGTDGPCPSGEDPYVAVRENNPGGGCSEPDDEVAEKLIEELDEINPCKGEMVVVDPDDILYQPQGGESTKLCGEQVPDPYGTLEDVLEAAGECDHATEGTMIGIVEGAVKLVCGGEVTDPEIPDPDLDPPEIPNPCGNQMLPIDEDWDPGESMEICGVRVPALEEVLADLEDALELGLVDCSDVVSLVEDPEGPEGPTICGLGQEDVDSTLDPIFQDIEENNPCSDEAGDPADFIFSFEPSDIYAICGGKIGDMREAVEDAEEDVWAESPCDPDHLFDETSVCGVSIPEPQSPSCDLDQNGGPGACVRYVKDESDIVQTYPGLPGIFMGQAPEPDAVAFGWLVGAPLLTVDIDPHECGASVCVDSLGVVGSYLVGSAEFSPSSSVQIAVNVQGASLEINAQNDVDVDNYASVLSGAVVVPSVPLDAEEKPLLRLSADILLFDALSESVTISASVESFSVSFSYEPLSDSLISGSSSLGWGMSVREWLHHIDSSQWTDDHKGAQELVDLAPSDGKKMEINWISPHRSNLDLGFNSLDIVFTVNLMPRNLIGGSLMYGEDESRSYFDVYWPGDDFVESFILNFGGIPVTITDPPRSFVVQLVLVLLEDDATGWSQVKASMRGAQSELEDLLGLVDAPGRMDVQTTVRGVIIGLSGLSHNMDFGLEHNNREDINLLPLVRLHLEDSTRPAAPVVESVTVLGGSALPVELTVDSVVRVSIDTDAGDYNMKMGKEGTFELVKSGENSHSINAEAKCFEVNATFHATETSDSGTYENIATDDQWDGEMVRFIGQASFQMESTCFNDRLDFNILSNGITLLNVGGLATGNFDYDITMHKRSGVRGCCNLWSDEGIEAEVSGILGSPGLSFGIFLEELTDGKLKLKAHAAGLQKIQLNLNVRDGYTYQGASIPKSVLVPIGWTLNSGGTLSFRYDGVWEDLLDYGIEFDVTGDQPTGYDHVTWINHGWAWTGCSWTDFDLIRTGKTKEVCDDILYLSTIAG